MVRVLEAICREIRCEIPKEIHSEIHRKILRRFALFKLYPIRDF